MPASEVNNRVAVSTHRSQVMHRIHLILTGDVGKGTKVMHENEPPHHVPIHGTEIGTTHATRRSMNLDASGTSSRIALVSSIRCAM